MKKFLATLSVLAVLSLVSQGCNTVKGIGKDVQTVGEKGQEVIDSSEKK